MRRRLLVPLAVVAMLAAGVLGLSGRGTSSPSISPQPALAAMPACADANVTFRLFTDSPVYLPGQSVRVTFEVRNAGSRWCKVAGQCDEVAPISIFDGARMIWSDKPCYNHEWDAVGVPLPPGRLLIQRGSWSTRGVRDGSYEARAAFLATVFLVL
ncbi:MAG: hypothetical protein M3Z98_08840 [Candidatus Dormibacteraeota bacterium]|nr:hypothetical protein [Candidatus Dormibacteraeota bacterium]